MTCALAEASVENIVLRGEKWPQLVARWRGHVPAPDPEVGVLEDGAED